MAEREDEISELLDHDVRNLSISQSKYFEPEDLEDDPFSVSEHMK